MFDLDHAHFKATVTVFLLISMQIAFSGAVSAQAVSKTAIQPKFSAFLRTELFFGMDKPTGGQVTEEEWQKFVADVVTPRFPNGLTVDDSIGQYLGGKILVREKSK